MNLRRRYALLVTATVLLVIAVVLLLRHGAAPHPSALSASPSTHPSPSSSPEARRARDAMHEQILAALRLRDAGAPPPRAPSRPSTPLSPSPSPAPAPPSDSADQGSYDPQYIRENVREQIFPLLASCYQEALSRNPKLAGKLVFSFRIVGDPSVGGVIEDAEFAEGTEIKDPEMETCTRESMMSLSLDKPPSGGGYVTVKYPVAFSPGDDDDAGDLPDGADAGDAGKR